MRTILTLGTILALMAGCSPASNGNVDQSVDINAAADAARHDIANYAASSADRDASAPASPAAANTVAPAVPTPRPERDPATPPAPGTPGGLPDDRTPISEAPFTPDSAQGAANVVQTYYALLGEGKYRRAWMLWDDAGSVSGMTAPAFAASFDKYSEYHANVGAPGRIDAGAGQRYVTVPVQIYGTLKHGGPFHTLGTVTLHHTADIDGATPAQRSWHIHTIDIKP